MVTGWQKANRPPFFSNQGGTDAMADAVIKRKRKSKPRARGSFVLKREPITGGVGERAIVFCAYRRVSPTPCVTTARCKRGPPDRAATEREVPLGSPISLRCLGLGQLLFLINTAGLIVFHWGGGGRLKRLKVERKVKEREELKVNEGKET